MLILKLGSDLDMSVVYDRVFWNSSEIYFDGLWEALEMEGGITCQWMPTTQWAA